MSETTDYIDARIRERMDRVGEVAVDVALHGGGVVIRADGTMERDPEMGFMSVRREP